MLFRSERGGAQQYGGAKRREMSKHAFVTDGRGDEDGDLKSPGVKPKAVGSVYAIKPIMYRRTRAITAQATARKKLTNPAYGCNYF